MISLRPFLYLGKLNQARVLTEAMNEMDEWLSRHRHARGLNRGPGGLWSYVLPLWLVQTITHEGFNLDSPNVHLYRPRLRLLTLTFKVVKVKVPFAHI